MARRRQGGFDRTFFEALGKDVTEKAKAALEEGAQIVVDEAKSRVPVKTGALKNSIHYIKQKKGTKIKIVADATKSSKDGEPVQYGQYVEFSPRINKPFLYPAMDGKRAEVRQKVIDAIKEACEKNAIKR